VRQLDDVGSALRLGQDDAVDVGDADDVEVLAMVVGPQRVDPYPP